MQDDRSRRRRAWSVIAALCIEGTALLALVAAAQLQAARASSQRLMRALRNELAAYRVVLVTPRLQAPRPAPTPKVVRIPRPQPKPLTVPDTRLLDRLDPQVAGFVKDNPGVESVLTREIVRDLDTHVLDPRKLLQKSSLRVSFDLAEGGAVSRPRIDKSSGVPSIDHLAIELSKTLGDYELPPVMNDIRRVIVSIEIGDEIVIRVEGVVRNAQETDQVRRQVQSALAFLRFALGSGEGAFILQEVALSSGDGKVTLTRRIPKAPMLTFLAKYYSQEPR
jgi:hypothetical protein